MGLEDKTLAGIINTSTGRCWSSDTYNPVIFASVSILNRGPSFGFASNILKKYLCNFECI